MATRVGAFPQLADKAWVIDQYITQGKSCPEIAAEIGCTAGAVEYRLRHFGVKARGRHYGHWVPKKCERCGDEFMPSGPAAKFCSAACRAGTATCEGCDKEFPLVAPRQQVQNGTVYPRKFCSFECRQAHWARTSAHRYVNGDGYVEIVIPPTMSRRIDGGGYVEINVGALNGNGGRVKEHRWVMEQRLGRTLLPHEEVHHKNGHRDDNDRCPACPASTLPPEVLNDRLHCASCGWESSQAPNLELWTISQPKGQRVEDKIAWAVGFLAEYGFTVAPPGAPA